MANFNLETATLEQCKALAYDLVVQLERVQKDLQIVNQAIAQKSKVEPKEVKKKEPAPAQ